MSTNESKILAEQVTAEDYAIVKNLPVWVSLKAVVSDMSPTNKVKYLQKYATELTQDLTRLITEYLRDGKGNTDGILFCLESIKHPSIELSIGEPSSMLEYLTTLHDMLHHLVKEAKFNGVSSALDVLGLGAFTIHFPVDTLEAYNNRIAFIKFNTYTKGFAIEHRQAVADLHLDYIFDVNLHSGEILSVKLSEVDIFKLSEIH